jgi:predicted nucleotide-binding protein (sugar kinase/HSP70/actin superfamily)
VFLFRIVRKQNGKRRVENGWVFGARGVTASCFFQDSKRMGLVIINKLN